MILKSVIHFPDTNSVEATWVEIVAPAYDVPESQAPDTTDAKGNVMPGEIIPAHTVPAVERQVRCHSYADVQMDMLESDLGEDALQWASLIQTVRAGIKLPTPEEIEAARIASIPQVVTMRQARLALLAVGMLGLIDAAINAQSEPFKSQARIEWDYATEIRRDWPTLVNLRAAVGLTEQQLDDLFIAASKL